MLPSKKIEVYIVHTAYQSTSGHEFSLFFFYHNKCRRYSFVHHKLHFISFPLRNMEFVEISLEMPEKLLLEVREGLPLLIQLSQVRSSKSLLENKRETNFPEIKCMQQKVHSLPFPVMYNLLKLVHEWLSYFQEMKAGVCHSFAWDLSYLCCSLLQRCQAQLYFQNNWCVLLWNINQCCASTTLLIRILPTFN